MVDDRAGVVHVKVTAQQKAAQTRIAAALSNPGFALPGTLSMQAYRCGKANCRCDGDPPRLHGPYALWTRKVGNKTVTRRLSEPELSDYRLLFDNARRLRSLLVELQELTLAIVDDQAGGEGSPPSAAS